MSGSWSEFIQDLERWAPARSPSAASVQHGREVSSTAELLAVDQALAECWGPLREQETKLKEELGKRWPWNPVFSSSSLLEPLIGLAPEPILTRGLAWLLRPTPIANELETLKTGLLRTFLALVFEGVQLGSEEVYEWTSAAEYQTRSIKGPGRQRIDILLKGPLLGEPTVVAIEAKLRSGLGPEQLERYVAAMKRDFPFHLVKLVLLTPEGRALNDRRVMPLSYAALAEAMMPMLMARQTDPGAGFAQLLLSDVVRGRNAGLPGHSAFHGAMGPLARIRAARACLKVEEEGN